MTIDGIAFAFAMFFEFVAFQAIFEYLTTVEDWEREFRKGRGY